MEEKYGILLQEKKEITLKKRYTYSFRDIWILMCELCISVAHPQDVVNVSLQLAIYHIVDMVGPGLLH